MALLIPRRDQTFHEFLIPLLVQAIGAESYLELGTHNNETIARVQCQNRYGVDTSPRPCPGVLMFTMDTISFIDAFAADHAPYDVVFIDADHSRKAVEADFNGIWPYVSGEGLVLMHDTNPQSMLDTKPGLCGDAWKFARKLSVDHEAVTLPYHPGLTIARKRVEWRPR